MDNATTRTKPLTLAQKRQQEYAASAPAIVIARRYSRSKAAPFSRWDVMHQAGLVPPWPLFRKTVLDICNSCPLRPMASPGVCRECPLVHMVRRMMKETGA